MFDLDLHLTFPCNFWQSPSFDPPFGVYPHQCLTLTYIRPPTRTSDPHLHCLEKIWGISLPLFDLNIHLTSPSHLRPWPSFDPRTNKKSSCSEFGVYPHQHLTVPLMWPWLFTLTIWLLLERPWTICRLV